MKKLKWGLRVQTISSFQDLISTNTSKTRPYVISYDPASKGTPNFNVYFRGKLITFDGLLIEEAIAVADSHHRAYLEDYEKYQKEVKRVDHILEQVLKRQANEKT